MTPRERLLTTMDHREPDRIPLNANLHLDLRMKLRQYYGVKTDEELFEKLGASVSESGSGGIDAGILPPTDWKPTPEYVEFCKETGSDVRSDYANYEEWGIRRKIGSKISEEREFYFTYHPWEAFTEANQVEDVELPSLNEPGRFDEVAEVVRERKDKYLIWGSVGHCQWTKAWELRGMLTFMKDLHVNPKMAEAILDKLLEYSCDAADRFLELGCDGISLTEDWGNNYSLFISPEHWRKYFKPRYKILFDRAKKRNAFVHFHSDGNITPIVGDLVEIGIDILNPVQPECMDPLEIKRKYGDKITISTGCSVQQTLPFGTVEDVRREVLYALNYLAPGGGFVYGTSHQARYEVPVENLVALYETCKKYGKYPIRIPSA